MTSLANRVRALVDVDSVDDFMSLVAPGITGTRECWEWIGSVNSLGYGEFRGHGKAYRFSFEAFVRPIRTGEIILHCCDNRRCVNPRHLRAGTKSDNTRDVYVQARAMNALFRLEPVGIVVEKGSIQ